MLFIKNYYILPFENDKTMLPRLEELHGRSLYCLLYMIFMNAATIRIGTTIFPVAKDKDSAPLAFWVGAVGSGVGALSGRVPF